MATRRVGLEMHTAVGSLLHANPRRVPLLGVSGTGLLCGCRTGGKRWGDALNLNNGAISTYSWFFFFGDIPDYQVSSNKVSEFINKSCLIKSWCSDKNICCRGWIPQAGFPSLGFRATSVQRSHRWTRHQHPDFERYQMPARSLYLNIQLCWKLGPQMFGISD